MLVNPFLTPGEQERFRSVTIGVAGAGGLGSNVLMHLVRSGLERFVIADFDRVSPGNLNRQFFFQDQVGRLKTEAVAENLRRINPDLSLQLHPVRITEENLWSVFGQCDLLVEAFDDAESKSMFIRKTVPWGRPVVAASGLAGWGGISESRACRRAGGEHGSGSDPGRRVLIRKRRAQRGALKRFRGSVREPGCFRRMMRPENPLSDSSVRGRMRRL